MQTVTIHTRLITNVGGQTEKIQNTFKGTWGIHDNRHLLSYNEADNGGPTHVLFDMVQAELRRMNRPDLIQKLYGRLPDRGPMPTSKPQRQKRKTRDDKSHSFNPNFSKNNKKRR